MCSASLLNHIRLFETPWTVAHQGPLSMGFSRQESWSGWPCPPPGDLPKPGIEPRSSSLQADSLPSEPPGKPMNTGVGSLSLLQGFFPTQESNQGTSLYIFCHRMQEVGCGFFYYLGVSKKCLLDSIFCTLKTEIEIQASSAQWFRAPAVALGTRVADTPSADSPSTGLRAPRSSMISRYSRHLCRMWDDVSTSNACYGAEMSSYLLGA